MIYRYPAFGYPTNGWILSVFGYEVASCKWEPYDDRTPWVPFTTTYYKIMLTVFGKGFLLGRRYSKRYGSLDPNYKLKEYY